MAEIELSHAQVLRMATMTEQFRIDFGSLDHLPLLPDQKPEQAAKIIRIYLDGIDATLDHALADHVIRSILASKQFQVVLDSSGMDADEIRTLVKRYQPESSSP